MNGNGASYPPSLSYWEISEYLTGIDLAVVGSGIVGLTSAIFFKKKNPNAKVVVLEKGTLPSGASTKNAGFACFGSLSELLSDLETESDDAVFKLVEQRVNGLSELRNMVGDQNLGFEACGGYELFLGKDDSLFEKCISFLPEANRILNELLNLDETYSMVDQSIAEFGFESTKHLILNRHEGSINTGKMMSHLVEMAQNLGIRVLNGCTVKSWSDSSNGVSIELNGNVVIQSRQVHIATNGFAKELLATEDVSPARAQVLITEPIENLKIKGTFHLDEGFYYFRNVGNQLLLGGGRNLDKAGETTAELDTTELIQTKLEELLREVILLNTEFIIDHRWSGVMGVGVTKKPIVKQVSDHVTCAVRMGGMGVALGTSIGKQSAEMIG